MYSVVDLNRFSKKKKNQRKANLQIKVFLSVGSLIQITEGVFDIVVS